MATAGELASQMQALTDKLGGMTPLTNDQIYSELINSVGGLRPMYQEVANLETDAFAAPAEVMASYYKDFPTAGTGVGAMNRLAGALRTVGQKRGTANIARGAIDVQKKRFEDIAANLVNMQNLQRQGLIDQYNFLIPRYNNANQRIENIENRAEQRDMFNQTNKMNQSNADRSFGLDTERFGLEKTTAQQNYDLALKQLAKSGSGGGGGIDMNAIMALLAGDEETGGIPGQGGGMGGGVNAPVPTIPWSQILSLRASYSPDEKLQYTRDIMEREKRGELIIDRTK